jgi:hypothetical protein
MEKDRHLVRSPVPVQRREKGRTMSTSPTMRDEPWQRWACRHQKISLTLTSTALTPSMATQRPHASERSPKCQPLQHAMPDSRPTDADARQRPSRIESFSSGRLGTWSD